MGKEGKPVGIKLQAWMEASGMALVNLNQMVALTVRPSNNKIGDIVAHGPDGKEWPLVTSVPLKDAYEWLAKASLNLNSKVTGGWTMGVVVPLG
jgi:hypothetical protein